MVRRPRRLSLLAAAGLALAAAWLARHLPAAWGVAVGGAALAAVLAVLVRELARGLPGELHLARAWLGLPTRTAPAGYVRGLFDSYAARYDAHLFAELDYRVPNLLRDLVGDDVPRIAAAADLGCGTGALGPLFRGSASRLDGVDLSPAMLARARRRGLYDELVEGDLVDFLRGRPGRYDLLLAADVLPYLGDPAPLLAAAAVALRPGGRLAVSAERHRDGAPFALARTGRFTHEPAAVLTAAAAFGLALERRLDGVLRRERGAPVEGVGLLLKKVVS